MRRDETLKPQAHCTTPAETVSMLAGEDALESFAKPAFLKPLEPETGIERRIPRHIHKGGQRQLAYTGAAACIDHLLQQPAPDTLPLGLLANRYLMKVQCLIRQPGAGKTHNAPSWILRHPTTTCLDESPVRRAIHDFALRQPGQCRPTDKSPGCRALDVR